MEKWKNSGPKKWKAAKVVTLPHSTISLPFSTTLPASLPRRLKGAWLALGSAACIAVTFVASKQAMQELTPLAFTPLWFISASIWGIGFYLLGNGPHIPATLQTSIRPILLLGFLNGLANLLFFTSINLGDPTLVAFFSRSETIYTVLLGTWLLGERMHQYQWLGVAVALLGTGIMTFQAGPLVWLILLLTLISNFFLALSALVAKKNIAAVSPLILSASRTILVSLMLGGVGMATGQLAWPSLTTWFWIIGGAFFGPFLSYVLFYESLRYISLSKGAVVRAIQPIFVAIYSLILFNMTVGPQQFMGGIIMIFGVTLMMWERR